jgi:uncharacterized membrane protein
LRSLFHDRLLWMAAAAGLLSVGLLGVEIDQLFSLPAHPLIVHVPVVLVPLLSIAALVCVARPRFRRTYGIAVGALAVASLYGTILAVGAGKKLQELRRDERGLDDHAQWGEQAMAVVAVLALLFISLLVVDRVRDRRAARSLPTPSWFGRPLVVAVSVLVGLSAVASTVWVARAGHTGAKIVWERRGGSEPRGSGDETPSPGG